MPIFFQQDIDASTRLGIWHIEEEASFFLKEVPLQNEITHPHKRLQHLAGRYLLKYLFPDFPVSLIRIADTRKPYLEDEAYHFSISHCGEFAGVIVSKEKRVGVDLELVSDKVDRIRNKFTGSSEEDVLQRSPRNNLEQVTLLWSCKEAVFKWYGLGQVDFKEHIELQEMKMTRVHQFTSRVLFKKNEDRLLDLHSHFFGGLCLSYLFT